MQPGPRSQPDPGSIKLDEPEEPILTDIVDEASGRLLVSYPRGLIVTLTALGVLAFVVTGLLGYDRPDSARFPAQMTLPEALLFVLDSVFAKPWLLYVFFCALIFTLQGSVLRKSELIRSRRAAFTATAVSMVIVALLYLYRREVLALLGDLIHASGKLRTLLQEASTNPWTYLALDVLLLALLFGQAAWRWIRRSPGQLSNPPIDLHTGRPVTPSTEELDVKASELIAGDLIVRGVVAGLLGLLFWYPVTSLLVRVLGQEHRVQPGSRSPDAFSFCTLSLPGTCTVGFSWEIWSLNVLVMIFTVAGGLALLAFVIQLEAMELISRQTDGQSQDPLRLGHEILTAFFDILLSPFNRQPRSRVGRRVSRNVQGPLRPLVWPLLVFLGVVGTAGLADVAQRWLQCPKFYAAADAVSPRCRLQLIGHPIISQAIENGLPTLAFAFLAVTGPTVAFAVMFARWRAASNTLRFLSLITLSNALPVASIAVALTLVNFGALLLAHLVDLSAHQGTPTLWKSWFGVDSATRLHPFYPGLFALTLYAFLAAYYLAAQTRSRGRRGAQKAE